MELLDEETGIKRNNETPKSKVEEWLAEFLDVTKINPKIMKRLELLNALTNFVEEEKEGIRYLQILFNYYKNKDPEKSFTKEEEDMATIGLILSDIGKTGPINANESQQALIIRLFGIEGVRDVKRPIREFIEEKFPEVASRDIDLLREMGIDPSMPIEKFWRLHSGWTLQIIEGDGIPEEDLPGAALHHILEGDNVDLIDEEGNFKTLTVNGEPKIRFGENRGFDRPEKLVVLLDKYVAFLRRLENMNHEKVIQKLRTKLAQNSRYANDPEFLELVEDLEKALKED